MIDHKVKVSFTDGTPEKVLGAYKATAEGEKAFGCTHDDVLAALATKLWESKNIRPWNLSE